MLAVDTLRKFSLLETPGKHVEWSIDDFLNLETLDNYATSSPIFSFANLKWYLTIYTNGDGSGNSEGRVCLYLFIEGPPSPYNIAYRMGIKRSDGYESSKVINDKGAFFNSGDGLGAKLVKRSTLSHSKDELMSNGILTVFCTIHVVDKQPVPLNLEAASQTLITSTMETAWNHPSDGLQTLIDNLKEAYICRRYTDIVIVVKEKEIMAHKIVLAARSNVFAAMFNNDMAEKHSGTVYVPDCDPMSFEQFILFLYTGNFDVISSSNVVNLYRISEKYDVQELKEQCRQYMTYEMNIDMFCDIVHLSTEYGESNLLTVTTEFFLHNVKCILPTIKWQNFLAEYPTLCNELLIKAFDKL